MTDLTIDMEKLAYISSAGIRVILTAQQRMYDQGEMVVKNANQQVLDVFDVTGLSDVLTIE